jgi:hypothetical protein
VEFLLGTRKVGKEPQMPGWLRRERRCVLEACGRGRIERGPAVGYITTRDGAEIFYKEGGSGQPVVFSHGWPLNADAWEDQVRFVAENGYRAVAHDRRGHGRSGATWHGNDMDTYADDMNPEASGPMTNSPRGDPDSCSAHCAHRGWSRRLGGRRGGRYPRSAAND